MYVTCVYIDLYYGMNRLISIDILYDVIVKWDFFKYDICLDHISHIKNKKKET